MWVVRELLRLIVRIVFAAAIAIVFAGVWAVASGGDFTRAMWVTLLLTGCLLILLAGTGSKTTMTSRVINWGVITPGRGGTIFRGVGGAVYRNVQPRPGDPTLTASAVFIGSGAVLIILGVIV
jgi:hypothetical protein